MVRGKDDLMSGTSHLWDFHDTIDGDSGASQRYISSHPHSEDGTRGKSLLSSASLVITHPIRQPLGNMPPDVQSILSAGPESVCTVEPPMGLECPLCG